jgi:hypothetical protein
MKEPLKQAYAFLDALEAERQAALALSAQKAEEAKLIQARLDGFRHAMKMLSRQVPVGNGNIGSSDEPAAPTAKGVTEAARKRRTRRNIPEVIVCELSLSGQAMTARQIAEGIGYNLERTEMALERLKQAGRLLCDGGRWAIAPSGLTQVNEPAVSVSNGKLRTSAEA